MLNNKPEVTNNIESGDESTNIQTRDNAQIHQTINQGLSYSDVRTMIMDVFKANFYDLGENAAEVAKARAEELVNDFLSKLQQHPETILENTKDPDLRYAIFEAQEGFARRGEKETADMLVDILIKRTLASEKPLLKLVLDEAIKVIPKLTVRQMDILSLIFAIRYINYSAPVPPFANYYNFVLRPFVHDFGIPISNAFYQHLQYAGCISISIGSSKFLPNIKGKFGDIQSVPEPIFIERLYAFPGIENIHKGWDQTSVCHSTLTSVGIAIAYSNLQRLLGQFDADLSIWINE
ncbi:MAG: LPO_1073/Vpar_1526 family protein [Sporolactobacillus sp.]